MTDILTPKGSAIFLERPEATKQIGAVHLPDSAHHTANEGYVYALGPDCDPRLAQVGDFVIYASYAAPEYLTLDDDTTLTIIDESEILAFERMETNNAV